jgi:hypothetical protein
MPNHVTTRCIVTGPQTGIDQFRNRAFRVEDDETIFDFNAFIPMPAAIKGTQASTVAKEGAALIAVLHDRAPTPVLRLDRIKYMRKELCLPKASLTELAQAWLAKHPEYFHQGARRLGAIAQTGFADWYDWSNHHWGTKWNAYHLTLESECPLEFYFDTAWAFPMPVFEMIAKVFPPLSFRCSCYDEGSCFAGDGFFNPEPGQPPFALCDATAELHERVYGKAEGGAA